jgi:hypothetical protein
MKIAVACSAQFKIVEKKKNVHNIIFKSVSAIAKPRLSARKA